MYTAVSIITGIYFPRGNHKVLIWRFCYTSVRQMHCEVLSRYLFQFRLFFPRLLNWSVFIRGAIFKSRNCVWTVNTVYIPKALRTFHSINFYKKLTYVPINLLTKQKPLFKSAAEPLRQTITLIIFAFSDATKKAMFRDIVIMVAHYKYHE